MVGGPGAPTGASARVPARAEAERPIAVFASGVGGLTVVRALEELLPQEHLVYFGDTARSPYGPRSVEEVHSFAFQIMDQMVRRDVKMLVIACNAMTAAAYEEARDTYPSSASSSRRSAPRCGPPTTARSASWAPR